MNIPILAYHKIDTAFEWGINTVSPHTFEKQIRYLYNSGFQSVKIQDIVYNKVRVEKPIVITFDDAYRSVHEFAFPILNKYQFSATVFVISDYVGKNNSWDTNIGGKTCMHLNFREICALIAADWEIGSHTVTHPDLIGLSDEDLISELRLSKTRLEDRLSVPVRIISYPYNRVNISVIEYARKIGYQGGCCLAVNTSIPAEMKMFNISRTGVYAIDTQLWFKLKLENSMIAHFDNMRQKAICFCAKGSVYFNRLKKIKKSIAI